MSKVVYGNKYEDSKHLDVAGVAKLVREDLKAAVKAGELPSFKYSVRISRFAGGSSMRVSVENYSGPRYAIRSRYGWSVGQHPVVLALVEKLSGIMKAYNYDGSDAQSDYFHVRFYDHVDVGSADQAACNEVYAELEGICRKLSQGGQRDADLGIQWVDEDGGYYIRAAAQAA